MLHSLRTHVSRVAGHFCVSLHMTSSGFNWDTVYKSNFESAAFWDVHWITKARDLYESARKLEPAMEAVWDSYRARAKNLSEPLKPDHYCGPYFMLVSYAVENLFKAAAVSRNSMKYKENFRLTGKFPDELKKHDLAKLAKSIALAVTQEEEDLLRRLTRSATWFGRYPSPLKYAEISGVEKFNDGREYGVSWFGREDVNKLRNFINGLPARLALPEAYWKDAG